MATMCKTCGHYIKRIKVGSITKKVCKCKGGVNG